MKTLLIMIYCSFPLLVLLFLFLFHTVTHVSILTSVLVLLLDSEVSCKEELFVVTKVHLCVLEFFAVSCCVVVFVSISHCNSFFLI